MGSCAKLWALDAGAFDRLADAPTPPAGSDAYEAAEALVAGWEYDPSVVVARWRDDADNDLSRIATGERRGLPADLDPSALAPLLGLGETPSLPWWARTLWPTDANAVGLLAPDAVRAMRDVVRASRLLAQLAPSLARLDAFLERAADAGCWILGVEGFS